jgi:hypothetical protein
MVLGAVLGFGIETFQQPLHLVMMFSVNNDPFHGSRAHIQTELLHLELTALERQGKVRSRRQQIDALGGRFQVWIGLGIDKSAVVIAKTKHKAFADHHYSFN